MGAYDVYVFKNVTKYSNSIFTAVGNEFVVGKGAEI